MPIIVLNDGSDEEETESESEHVEEPPALTPAPSPAQAPTPIPAPTPMEAQTEETPIEEVQVEETCTEDPQSTQETQGFKNHYGETGVHEWSEYQIRPQYYTSPRSINIGFSLDF